MIDLQMKTISIGLKTEMIKSFECWFRTPMGIHDRIEHAITQCEKQEWDANTVIVPVAVAVGSTIYEEIGRA